VGNDVQNIMDDYDDISDEDLMLAFEQAQDPSFPTITNTATASNQGSVRYTRSNNSFCSLLIAF
jgi:hypothetical protein